MSIAFTEYAIFSKTVSWLHFVPLTGRQSVTYFPFMPIPERKTIS